MKVQFAWWARLQWENWAKGQNMGSPLGSFPWSKPMLDGFFFVNNHEVG